MWHTCDLASVLSVGCVISAASEEINTDLANERTVLAWIRTGLVACASVAFCRSTRGGSISALFLHLAGACE